MKRDRLKQIAESADAEERRNGRAEEAGAESVGRNYDRFAIDKNKLDELWFDHPRKFAEAADKLADARYDYDRAKAERDLVRAEVELSIRQHPSEYGLEEVREQSVKACLEIQPQVQAAEAKVLHHKHAVDVGQVDVDALEVMKKSLENGVKLFLADYFKVLRTPEGYEERKTDKAFGKKRN